ncbi:hypothetical protein [Gordonia neofelifaecis]|uniref:hypothetical protein n=1 Tax=Gordonia neofelifaecis TaxID=945692 RepID=UPI001EE69334|nr:hypothetical protein [Gordonia neofelifaecis]
MIAACRDLGLTGVVDDEVRRPHAPVDEFRLAALAADATRLRGLAERLAMSGTRAAPASDWSGRSGRAALGALTVVTGDVAQLRRRLSTGAAATSHAAEILEAVLGRHAAVLRTVSRPRLGGVDLDAVPAALNSGALDAGDLRAELHARLDFAETAGAVAADAIAVALAEVASAWSADAETDGDLALADLR